MTDLISKEKSAVENSTLESNPNNDNTNTIIAENEKQNHQKISFEGDIDIQDQNDDIDQPLNLNISDDISLENSKNDDEKTNDNNKEIPKEKNSIESPIKTIEEVQSIDTDIETIHDDLLTLKSKLEDIDKGANQLKIIYDQTSKSEIINQNENNSKIDETIEPFHTEDVINSTIVQKEHSDNNKNQRYKNLIDSDSEEEETNSTAVFQNECLNNNRKYKHALIDSDSEDDEIHKKKNNDDNIQSSKNSKTTLKMSAKEAELQRKSIKSETQRLTRETQISIPYHKPKKFTLQEFMTRRTVFKPSQLLQNSKDKMNQMRNCSKLKMTPEELERYSEFLETRAKEASEFFKSEEENQEEENKIQINNKENENSSIPSSSIKESQEQSNLNSEYNDNENNSEKLDIEVLRKLLKEDKNSIPELSKIPKLKGDSNMLVDLENGECISPKPLSGVDNLLNKFLKHSVTKRKSTTTSTISVNILSTNNGILEMSNAKINMTNDDIAMKLDEKPGSSYVKLKENLKNLIAQKRRSELTKKIQENQYNSEKETENDDDEEENDEEEEEEEKINENEDNIEKDKDDEYEKLINEDEEYEKNSKEDNEDENLENDQSDDADDELEDDNNDSEEDIENSITTKSKSKKRIIRAFQDSDDDDDDDKNENENKPKITDDTLPASRFYEEEFDNNDKSQSENFSEQDYMKMTQATTQNKSIISQIPTTQMSQGIVDDDELMYLCSGKFTIDNNKKDEISYNSQDNKNENIMDLQTSDDEQDIVNSNKNKKKKKYGPIDDDDDDDDDDENEKKKNNDDKKKLNKHVDEDEDDDNQDKNENEDDEIIETYIDYDSEENEIEVKLTKNDRLKKIEEFVENEAELSESEWDSEDEDEKGLDKYDNELGDEENFDQEQLHDELEKIHMRKMLDQDAREIKKIQEMFFEDEENDGIGRQRQFKWKNLENSFTLDDNNQEQNQNDEGNDNGSDDEQNEEYWRKMRHERQQLLKEKNLITEETTILHNSSGGIKEIQLSQKKLTILKAKDKNTSSLSSSSSSSINNIRSPFLITKSDSILKRASFLGRDQETLEKLASLMKMNTEKDEDDEMICVNKAVNSRNFVFQVISSNEKNDTKTKNLKRRISENNDNNDKMKRKRYKAANIYNKNGKKTVKT